MRRRASRHADASVSLFPFLAVLICTMGALIVLLVVIVQQARVQADTIAADARTRQQTEAEKREELRLEREKYQWQIEMLSRSREKTSERLSEARLELSHLEDHARRVQQKLQRLAEASRQLQDVDQQRSQRRADAEEVLRQLEQQIAEAKRQLAEAQEKAARQRGSFALVPYDGPNGTRRRPIYIECLSDRVVLQPEGITLTGRDFRGPLGPGNPLSAALRATREYLASLNDASRIGEPYPLLVVRPGGAESYAAARTAMKSWDAEFGYELVDDSMRLEYPPPDPALARLLKETIERARRQQYFGLGLGFASANPANSSEGGFRASSRYGGFVNDANEDVDVGNGFVEEIPDAGNGPEAGSTSIGQTPNRGDGADRRGLSEPQTNASSAAAAAATPAATTTSSSSSANAPDSPASSANETATASQASLATTRGRDWALPNAAQGAMGVTRPITLWCDQNRLILRSERNSGSAHQTLAMNGPTRNVIEPLTAAVWKRIESWGMAGPGLYWKPVLQVSVAPDADWRFANLQALMKDSGVEVVRK